MSNFFVILHDAKDNSASGRAQLRSKLGSTLSLESAELERIFGDLPAILRLESSKHAAEELRTLVEQLGGIAEVLEELTAEFAGEPIPQMPEPKSQKASADASTPVKKNDFMTLDYSLDGLDGDDPAEEITVVKSPKQKPAPEKVPEGTKGSDLEFSFDLEAPAEKAAPERSPPESSVESQAERPPAAALDFSFDLGAPEEVAASASAALEPRDEVSTLDLTLKPEEPPAPDSGLLSFELAAEPRADESPAQGAHPTEADLSLDDLSSLLAEELAADQHPAPSTALPTAPLAQTEPGDRNVGE